LKRGELRDSGADRPLSTAVRAPDPSDPRRDWRHELRQGWRRRLLVAVAYFLGWAVIAVPVALTRSSAITATPSWPGTMLSSRRPETGGRRSTSAPSCRMSVYPTGAVIGVHIDVGATNLDDYSAMIRRYAVIASQPEAEVSKVSELVRDMMLDAVVTGAVVGLAGPGLWLLIGRRRRTELLHRLTVPRAVVGMVTAVAIIGVAVSTPFDSEPKSTSVAGNAAWQPISDLVPETTVRGEAARLQVHGGLITSGTKALIKSAFDTYDTSLTFYRDLRERAPELAAVLHQPLEGETVAMLVSDRHDNIGMDPVSRAIADADGATILFDAGDDTSTARNGRASAWIRSPRRTRTTTTSTPSLATTTTERFVSTDLADKGFTVLGGAPIKAADGIRLLGAPDPRSSGLEAGRRLSGLVRRRR
jgi:hypothetical protein